MIEVAPGVYIDLEYFVGYKEGQILMWDSTLIFLGKDLIDQDGIEINVDE